MSRQKPAADWFGVVNLNKPTGWTSRQAVDHVKRLVKPDKIGHAGTLDPLATGVLVLVLGRATRLVPYLHDLTKVYRAEFLLGRTSPTDDTEVDVEILTDAPELTRDQISAVLPQFVGEVEQVPPAYSAVKLKGQRAYELARSGKTPQIEPRTVRVDAIELLAWDPPRLELEIVCGSGTYIRSIGRDLARTLGSGAVMSGLIRTRIGPFDLSDAVLPEELTRESLAAHVVPAQSALVDMPQLTVTEDMLERLQRGLRCPAPTSEPRLDGTEIAVLNGAGRLILIAIISDRGQVLQPRQVFDPKSGRL